MTIEDQTTSKQLTSEKDIKLSTATSTLEPQTKVSVSDKKQGQVKYKCLKFTPKYIKKNHTHRYTFRFRFRNGINSNGTVKPEGRKEL